MFRAFSAFGGLGCRAERFPNIIWGSTKGWIKAGSLLQTCSSGRKLDI